MSWHWGAPGEGLQQQRHPRGRHRQPRRSLAPLVRELAEQVAVRFAWGMCAVVIALCAWHLWGAS